MLFTKLTPNYFLNLVNKREKEYYSDKDIALFVENIWTVFFMMKMMNPHKMSITIYQMKMKKTKFMSPTFMIHQKSPLRFLLVNILSTYVALKSTINLK